MEKKTVKDMVLKWLEDSEYDGLCNETIECGCGKDDLMPCDSVLPDCQAAYRWDRDKCKAFSSCEYASEACHCFHPKKQS